MWRGREGEREGEMERLFATEKFKGRLAYKLYAFSVFIGICMILWYRVTNIPEGREKWAWIGMLCSEFWYAFYWIVTQSARWSPIKRYTFKDKFYKRYGSKLPGVDVYVCTADPYSEPPNLVISTVLSVMAYNYPTDKLNVYLSDDGGSILTFYALWEASHFAKHWLPFCKRYNVEPRSPAAYFSSLDGSNHMCDPKEWAFIKDLHEEMTNRIDKAVLFGKIPEEIKANHKGFSEWNSEMSSRNHQPIVQVLIDAKEHTAVDKEGNLLPTLVYMAREKRPQHHHNFKAGAMNALIRVSSVISNNPIILNVDCDMYSNNSETIADALCFFLDEEMGQNIGFVQYPQNYYNMTKNDIYGNSLNVINAVELHGLDNWGGPLYIGTGCFHRRKVLCGRRYSKDYKEDWNTGVHINRKNIQEIEEKAKSLATCTYEQNTEWGNEIGLKYGIPVEDVVTGLSIQYRGWKSVYFNPPRKGFIGVAPTKLAQTILQHKRWSEGNLIIFLSKYCTLLSGHGKIKLGLQLGYCIYNLWALNSFPTIYFVIIPSLGLLKGIPLFSKVSSPWFIAFAYVPIAKYVYSLAEALYAGDTLKGWWNGQRMWMIKRITSYLYGFIDTIRKMLGISAMSFTITAKVSEEDALKRYKEEIMEFGSSSPAFVIIATVALLNLVCLVGGLSRLSMSGWGHTLGPFLLQVILCSLLVIANIPVYEALFLRKDKGSLPFAVTTISTGMVMLACLIPIF